MQDRGWMKRVATEALRHRETLEPFFFVLFLGASVALWQEMFLDALRQTTRLTITRS